MNDSFCWLVPIKSDTNICPERVNKSKESSLFCIRFSLFARNKCIENKKRKKQVILTKKFKTDMAKFGMMCNDRDLKAALKLSTPRARLSQNDDF
ncbi:hypothetical protein ASG14_11970 [Pedobacter sp. Leaf194]|nr:hypothetical protein ASG14_11970 [Pedobacter sp. Leaf194]